MTQAPVITPTVTPTVEPVRRMRPGEICPNQRQNVPDRIRRELDTP